MTTAPRKAEVPAVHSGELIHHKPYTVSVQAFARHTLRKDVLSYGE